MAKLGKRKRRLLEAQRAAVEDQAVDLLEDQAVDLDSGSVDEHDHLLHQLGTLRLDAHVRELALVDELRARGVPWAAMAPAYNVRSAQAVQQRVSRLRQRVVIVTPSA